jgi:Response regulators consisting of a CheY-like receiver domain and a winged-helix DNA-binding domain
MKTKILLVDDERDIVEFLKYNLEQEDFSVITAYDGAEALEKMEENPDMVILDIMMPKLNGFEVCKKIRQNQNYENIPVIFLTAKGGEADEIQGLELGAVDYIQKPISPKKLVARVKANMRRFDGKKDDEAEQIKEIEIGPLKIDKKKYVVLINGVQCIFPRKEFELLFFLACNPGRVFNREALLKEVWGSDVFVVDRTVDVHIRKIREKLSDNADLIETIKGVGYRFKHVD